MFLLVAVVRACIYEKKNDLKKVFFVQFDQLSPVLFLEVALVRAGSNEFKLVQLSCRFSNNKNKHLFHPS